MGARHPADSPTIISRGPLAGAGSDPSQRAVWKSARARAGAPSASLLRTESAGLGDPRSTHFPLSSGSLGSSLCPSPVSASVSHARPKARGRLPEESSPPPSTAAAGLGSRPGRAGPGVASAARDPPAPGSVPRRAATPPGAQSAAPPQTRERVKEAGGTLGTGGAQGTSTHSGKAPARCCRGPPRRLAPSPAPRPARPGRGGRGRSAAAGAGLGTVLPELQGRGSGCFGFAAKVWGSGGGRGCRRP